MIVSTFLINFHLFLERDILKQLLVAINRVKAEMKHQSRKFRILKLS